MDIPFDVIRWQPTSPSRPGDAAPESEELSQLSQTLAAQSKILLRHPYNPANWLRRAKTLRKLCYPELALGDAHRATLLCESHLRHLENDAEGNWRLGHSMGFWMQETRDGDPALQDRLADLQAKARQLEEKTFCSPKSERRGKFYPRPYPWMEKRWENRSDELIARINRELTENAHASFDKAPYCRVKPYAFGDTGPGSRDILGVFATQEIKADELVLLDSTRIQGCCGPGSGGDTSNLGGGTACGDPVHPNLPDEEMWMDLRWVREETGKDATSALLTIRMLLAAIQDGYEHPLDHPLVARCTPNYPPLEDKDATPESFFLVNDIEVPFRALQQFGVDIFANPNFDTWVLFTVSQRQYNNVCGDSISSSLMPLFSLFNHSCEPNVGWNRFIEFTSLDGDRKTKTAEDEMHRDRETGWWDDKDACGPINHNSVAIKTLRDVKAGEQLFVEYDSFEHDKPVRERRRRLRKWLSGDCLCVRCVREVAEEEAREAEKGGQRRDSRVQGEAWDDGERVQFPEDEEGLAGKKMHWY